MLLSIQVHLKLIILSVCWIVKASLVHRDGGTFGWLKAFYAQIYPNIFEKDACSSIYREFTNSSLFPLHCNLQKCSLFQISVVYRTWLPSKRPASWNQACGLRASAYCLLKLHKECHTSYKLLHSGVYHKAFHYHHIDLRRDVIVLECLILK